MQAGTCWHRSVPVACGPYLRIISIILHHPTSLIAPYTYRRDQGIEAKLGKIKERVDPNNIVNNPNAGGKQNIFSPLLPVSVKVDASTGLHCVNVVSVVRTPVSFASCILFASSARCGHGCDTESPADIPLSMHVPGPAEGRVFHRPGGGTSAADVRRLQCCRQGMFRTAYISVLADVRKVLGTLQSHPAATCQVCPSPLADW